jgi:hypothetical protein
MAQEYHTKRPHYLTRGDKQKTSDTNRKEAVAFSKERPRGNYRLEQRTGFCIGDHLIEVAAVGKPHFIGGSDFMRTMQLV